nr:unnamed protein product [Digitaria exilis]
MGSGCNGMDEEPNGSKAVTLLLRLSTMALALTSAVLMATASDYVVGFSIVATILEAAGIYLQFGEGGGDDDEEETPKLNKILLVLIDVLVPALLNLATGATFSAVVAYGPQISACAGTAGRFCDEVHRSKLFSLGASISAVLKAAAKDVPLKFSVWPISSDDC